MNYKPNPIDVSDVKLPQELIDLADKISENCHEVWAKGRESQGWKFGPVRDDAKKEHPCMVPYSQLSEEEKSYDLNTSFETLKLVVKLGYEIKKIGE